MSSESLTTEQSFATRLAWLIAQHTQAGLARKTGTPPQKVSRYARGTKVPIDFAERLVEKLGVNPSWLLAGEGTPYLIDIGSENVRLAAGLLDIVQALGAVTKMRLGALGRTDYRRTLHALDDALRQYEDLRARLYRQTAPIFRMLIVAMQKAIIRGNFARVRGIEAAARQVGRLCDDDALAAEFEMAQALHAHETGDDTQAVAVQRRAFLRALFGDSRDNDFCMQALNYASALFSVGQIVESRRVCQAALALTEGCEQVRAGRAHLHALAAYGVMERGALAEGLTSIQAVIQHCGDYPSASGFLLFGQLAAGFLTLPAALAMPAPVGTHVFALLRFARWEEDLEAIETIATRHEPLIERLAVHAATVRLFLALRDGKAAARRALRQASLPSTSAYRAFTHTVACTHVARLAADRDAARRSLQEADRHLAALPPGITTALMDRADHYRNALDLCPKKSRATRTQELRQRAQAFFDQHVRAGYACFQAFATPDSNT